MPKDAGGGFVFYLCNFVDADLCVVGAMTMFLAKAFSPFHLKGDHLVTLNVIDDLSFDDSLDIFPDGQFVVAVGQEDLSKLHFIAGVASDPGDVQSLVFLDLKLLTGYFHYC
jgi:hypothetical protein